MSEQQREKRVGEAIELLSRLMPAVLDSDRDRLFFRAGEASARIEAATPKRRQFVWSAAAASLAMVAAGLAYALAAQQPEVQIVYIERPTTNADREAENQSNSSTAATRQATSRHDVTDTERASRTFEAGTARRLLDFDGMIQPQDYRALSDAFATQLRLRNERVLEREATLAAVSSDRERETDEAPAKERPRTYLEMRDTLRAM